MRLSPTRDALGVLLATTALWLPATAAGGPGAESLPGDSVYHLRASLTDSDGATTSLTVWRGHPVLIAMFYGTCPHACPTLIQDIRRVEAEIDEKARSRLRVLLVSFDAARDTPEALRKLAATHRLDTTRWRLCAARDDDATALAALLGVRYRKNPDGSFGHNMVVNLLDAEGVPVARIEGAGESPEGLLEKLRAVAAKI
jgi:protein SCO1/2